MKKQIIYELLVSVAVFMYFVSPIARAQSLHDAAAEGNVEQMTSLIADGADLYSLATLDQNLEAMPIHFAARTGSLAAIELLLDSGVDVDVRTPPSKMTPLCVAALYGQLEAVRLLIEKGADVNVRIDGGGTAIGLAAQYSSLFGSSSLELVELLLENGADSLIRPINDWTALHGAAIAGDARIVELLIDHGADVNLVSKGQFGTPPIYRAAMAGHLEVIQVLLSNGAEVNLQDNFGRTALVAAAVEGHGPIVKFLLENGADPSIRDSQGNTPQQHAAYNKQAEIVRLINDYKARK